MIEKGRLMKLKRSTYPLFGLALICWLHCYHQQKSPWLIWMVPSVFLGLGMLAKDRCICFFLLRRSGPFCIERGICGNSGIRPHLGGIVIYLNLRLPGRFHTGGQWERVSPKLGRFNLLAVSQAIDFKLGHWLLNIPRALAYFCPGPCCCPGAGS